MWYLVSDTCRYDINSRYFSHFGTDAVINSTWNMCIMDIRMRGIRINYARIPAEYWAPKSEHQVSSLTSSWARALITMMRRVALSTGTQKMRDGAIRDVISGSQILVEITSIVREMNGVGLVVKRCRSYFSAPQRSLVTCSLCILRTSSLPYQLMDRLNYPATFN